MAAKSGVQSIFVILSSIVLEILGVLNEAPLGLNILGVIMRPNMQSQTRHSYIFLLRLYKWPLIL